MGYPAEIRARRHAAEWQGGVERARPFTSRPRQFDEVSEIKAKSEFSKKFASSFAPTEFCDLRLS
jgi:hypothetical protein